MPEFVLAGGSYRFRPLKQTDPRQAGWDVFALQTALDAAGHDPGGADGIFGRRTRDAVSEFQKSIPALTVDGIAGVATQRELALTLVRKEAGIPKGLLYGMVEKESGFQLGNHTGTYSNGSRDCGVVQRNTMYATVEQAFNVKASLDMLADRLRTKNVEYERYGVIKDERRLWELAAGSWNAPAWADRLAKGQSLSEYQRTWIEGYIDRVCSYLVI